MGRERGGRACAPSPELAATNGPAAPGPPRCQGLGVTAVREPGEVGRSPGGTDRPRPGPARPGPQGRWRAGETGVSEGRGAARSRAVSSDGWLAARLFLCRCASFFTDPGTAALAPLARHSKEGPRESFGALDFGAAHPFLSGAHETSRPLESAHTACGRARPEAQQRLFRFPPKV